MKTILIIDDDLFVQQAYRDKFTHLGYHVIPAFGHTDVSACITAKTIPDIIILDVVMPEKDGFDILGEIKQQDIWKSVPVIMLTNLDTERERARQMGVTEYLVKSNITIEHIAHMIKKIIGD